MTTTIEKIHPSFLCWYWPSCFSFFLEADSACTRRKEATLYLIRSESIQHNYFFVAAIRPKRRCPYQDFPSWFDPVGRLIEKGLLHATHDGLIVRPGTHFYRGLGWSVVNAVSNSLGKDGKRDGFG